MALDTYGALKASIADWMHRSNLTGVIPDFVALTEAKMRRVLQARFQDISGTITTVAGTDSAALPSDLLRLRAAVVPNYSPGLTYVTPAEYQSMFETIGSGAPRYYTIIGYTIKFGPVPDAAYVIKCVYEQEIPALTMDSDFNSLLTKWPDTYLFGALSKAAEYSRNWDLHDRFEQNFMTALAEVNLLDWQTPGSMRMRTDTYTP